MDINNYDDWLWEIRDKRVDGWPLMESVWPTLIICMTYMITSKFLGPLYMRNRASYKLYGAIRLYNVIQVIASIYMFVNLMRYGWWNHYNWACQNVELSTNPDSLAMKMAVLCWWCYLSHSSCHYASLWLVSSSIPSRRSRNLWRSYKCICSYSHVQLLLSIKFWT
ncbi:ELOVL7 [Lepeophtheirus salmonis]|uniref:Elongation of very long chain fatty acids protein n=1 Tax=Lepeophtheirus salmonis TaxID=72036 RepID=A0A7R8H8Q0_LEPSM|nr:ELOVL7 [Lepeophtheirus salmonis]CAF2934763.1 ELOVL7 [Lepeophtheirus salmonis]